MADESELARILAGYGEGYRNPLMDSDSADFNTANVLAGMNAQQTAKEREGQDALARIVATLFGAGAAVRGALPQNLSKAIDHHSRVHRDNPMVNPVTSPFLNAYLAAMTPVTARAMQAWEAGSASPVHSLLLRGRAGLQGHAEDTASILRHLNRTDPPKVTLY